ncbi:hypothetical protein OAT44_05460 [Alphaproteobacteria bacterium]|nr:hypothetical protein [Alphaproteobacteria bacterium]
MVSSKTQKTKSDQETIIDMEPVKEEHKKSFLKNSYFIIIFSSLIITIISILWLIFYYLPNFYQLKNNKIEDLANRVVKLETLDKAPNNEELKNLKLEIQSLRSQIDNIDLNLVNSSSLEIENINQKISLINNEILKIIEIQKNQQSSSDTLDNLSNTSETGKKSNSIETIKKIETPNKSQEELINEARAVIEKLLKRKDLGSLSKQEFNEGELDTYNKIKNYLAGFLKLRQFSDDLSPRSLITKAEKELDNKNLKKFINIIKQLPDNWKIPINNFIVKAENALEIINNEAQ